jgi:hypothetical protein
VGASDSMGQISLLTPDHDVPTGARLH